MSCFLWLGYLAMGLAPLGSDSFSQGLDALGRQDYDLAVACFRAAIKADPRNVEAFQYLGDAYREKGDFPQANYFYSMVIRRDLGVPHVYNSRGEVYTKLGLFEFRGPRKNGEGGADLTVQTNHYDLAIMDFSEAIRLDPSNPVYYRNRSIAYARNGQYERAIAGLDEALNLNPRFAAAYADRGLVFARLGNFERAQAEIDQAIRTDRNDPSGYLALAWLQATAAVDKFRNGKQAVENALKAYNLSPLKDRDATLLATVAAAFAADGQFDEAARWQRRALRALAGYGTDYLDTAQKQLKLYQEKKPYREE